MAENNRFEAGLGFSYPFISGPDGTMNAGVDLTYLAYDQNLRFFTLGHGGYFGPQRYLAVNFPDEWRSRVGDLGYRLGATVGYATWQKDSAPFFPNNANLQRQLEQQVAGTPLVARYQGRSQTGFVAALRAEADYAITRQFALVGALTYDKAADFDETRVMLRMMSRY